MSQPLQNNGQMLAVMEKTKMYVLKGIEAEVGSIKIALLVV